VREIHAEARANESVPDPRRVLADEMATLVHQKVALAKAELSEKARGVGASASPASERSFRNTLHTP